MSNEERREDRVDALLSASMDERLSPDERAELDALLAQAPVAARAEAFRQVDDTLRALAQDSVDERRLASSLETLRDRLGASGQPPARGGAVTRLHPVVYGGLAAAAAAILFLAIGFGGGAPGPGEKASGETPSLVEASGPTDPVDEALVTALGYAAWAGDVSELGLASPEDLEVVEQLELLDFLAAREAEGQG